jgi:hypothetical protein
VGMKSLSREMPLSLMAIPISRSVPSESAVSRWIKPLNKAVVKNLINLGRGTEIQTGQPFRLALLLILVTF